MLYMWQALEKVWVLVWLSLINWDAPHRGTESTGHAGAPAWQGCPPQLGHCGEPAQEQEAHREASWSYEFEMVFLFTKAEFSTTVLD